MNKFLKARQIHIIDKNHRPVILKGVNLGGWLMMEGYLLNSPNHPEQKFKQNFKAVLGAKALDTFEKDFRQNFIQELDIKRIAGYGFNSIRVPFHHRLIEKDPYHYDEKGLNFLDQLIRWAKDNQIYVILDLHGACGSQNHDWHSDSLGPALLWEKKSCQDRTFALWEFLAERYCHEETIAGYDIVNESVTEDKKALNAFYRNVIRRIRHFDRNHILFIEGNKWATDLDCLDDFDDDNLVYSVHAYQPLDFTFNFVPYSKYPYRDASGLWDKKRIKASLENYAAVSEKKMRPIWVGEFGVNNRQGFSGEDLWVKDIVSCFSEFGFSWAYWTYKSVKNHVFPDGILSLVDNPPWVNRQGPLFGWDTYASHWSKRRNEIIDSWKTENYKENTAVLHSLKGFLNS